MTEFQIRKDNFLRHLVVETDTLPALGEGGVLLRVDRFAFTANNITYAATGDILGYWQFFPPHGDDAAGWGIPPVWGFADVVQSHCTDLPVGERLFGYFPPATHMVMQPARVSAQRVFDGAAHRSKLPPGYNSYSRVAAETGYQRSMDNARMLLWPLHITSFCLWDLLQQNQWFGAKQLVILSASSKTSIGLAYGLAADVSAPPVVAATSERNRVFVEGLALYTSTVTYEQITQIDPSLPTAIVDMSGNGDLLGALHQHLGDNMLRCINVGLTHWEEGREDPRINRERSAFFFAPSHIQQRIADWGADGFAAKSAGFLRDTSIKSMSWLHLNELHGLPGLASVYADVCGGRTAPEQGLVVVM